MKRPLLLVTFPVIEEDSVLGEGTPTIFKYNIQYIKKFDIPTWEVLNKAQLDYANTANHKYKIGAPKIVPFTGTLNDWDYQKIMVHGFSEV